MTTPEVAVGAAICWLARSPGLPMGCEAVRVQVVPRHPESCDWCDYELDTLMEMIESRDAVECARFERMSRTDQRALVDRARGHAA